MIVFPCKPSDSLDWRSFDFPSDKKYFVRLDLGLEMPFFPIDDEMHFQALSIALAQFTKEIWENHGSQILGAVLYVGSLDFSSYFSWTPKQLENWEVWKKERPDANLDHQKRLFCADAFAYYFQMLAHKLPDELPIYLFFDAEECGSSAEKHQVVSQERFSHFMLACNHLPFSRLPSWNENGPIQNLHPSTALTFPEEAQCSEEVLQKIDTLMHTIPTAFRVIEEAFLTESWDGVDDLIVLRDSLSAQGERKLKGFLATGGNVIYK